MGNRRASNEGEPRSRLRLRFGLDFEVGRRQAWLDELRDALARQTGIGADEVGIPDPAQPGSVVLEVELPAHAARSLQHSFGSEGMPLTGVLDRLERVELLEMEPSDLPTSEPDAEAGGDKLMSSPDELLVEQIKTGSDAEAEDAIARLMEEWHRKLYQQAHRRLRDHEAAEDVANFCILKAWQLRERPDLYRPQLGFSRWIRRVCSNAIVDWVRRRRRSEQHERQDERIENRSSVPVDNRVDTTDPTAQLIAAEDSAAEHASTEWMLDCMNRLSPEDRDLLQDRFWRGLTIRQLVEERSTPRSTVQRQVVRAVTRLRTLMRGEDK